MIKKVLTALTMALLCGFGFVGFMTKADAMVLTFVNPSDVKVAVAVAVKPDDGYWEVSGWYILDAQSRKQLNLPKVNKSEYVMIHAEQQTKNKPIQWGKDIELEVTSDSFDYIIGDHPGKNPVKAGFTIYKAENGEYKITFDLGRAKLNFWEKLDRGLGALIS